MLTIESVSTYYGAVQALDNVSIRIGQGEIVALVGANGAGKSTLLKTISGLVRPARGSIRVEEEEISRLSPDHIVSRGIVHVPEGRRVFPGLTVLENLRLGACARPRASKAELANDTERVLTLFPQLRARARQPGWALSGGEQQMLAIGRGLMARPRLLMLDEPSLGLAPILVDEVFRTIGDISKQGITILLVEQNAYKALHLAGRGYVLETGRVVLEDTGRNLLGNQQVKVAYLGG